MTVCLVHGNPETAAVWDAVAPLLNRAGPLVRLSPPGFGAPVRPDFGATVEEYRLWLIDALEGIDGPVDLVGHDWGGAHVVNVAMTRPDLIRSWASDLVGIFDENYEWHDLAQSWVIPGVGEDAVAAMVTGPVTEHAAALFIRGMSAEVAGAVAAGQDATMGECILRLYRDAAQPTMALLGRHLEAAAARPGLSIVALADHRVGTEEQRLRASARAGARVARLDGLGHCWFTQDPQRAADVLVDFWTTVDG